MDADTIIGVLADYVVDVLVVEDVHALLPGSPRLLRFLRKNGWLAPFAFALTRPTSFHIDGPSLSMSTWRWIWIACSRSVQDAGIDPALWLRAAHVKVRRQEERQTLEQETAGSWQTQKIEEETEGCWPTYAVADPCLVNFLAKSQGSAAQENITVKSASSLDVSDSAAAAAQISAVLMANADVRYVLGELSVETSWSHALVVLSDGNFAWMSMRHDHKYYVPNSIQQFMTVRGPRGKGAGLLCLHQQLPGALALAGAQWDIRGGHLVGRSVALEELGDQYGVLEQEMPRWSPYYTKDAAMFDFRHLPLADVLHQGSAY